MLKMALYEFLEPFRDQESPRIVCVGPREAIEPIWPLDQIKEAFGGCLVFGGEGGEEFVGVWGARNAGRFRRQLRERGADFTLSKERSSGLRMRSRSVVLPRRAKPPVRG